MIPRAIPEPVLAELRVLALDELGELLANLDAGNLVLLDYSKVSEANAAGKPTGVKTYAFTVRKP